MFRLRSSALFAALLLVCSVAAQAQTSGAFNPEISLILSGGVTGSSEDSRQDATGANGRERRVQGAMPSGAEAWPAGEGAALGESELALSANIDPQFRGTLLAAISPEGSISAEEANIQTLGLGYGLNLKAGRFFSGLGYANEQHPHAWDFSDAALPYRVFFGPRLQFDGAQIRWLAPLDFFLELGAETGKAQGFPANDTESTRRNAQSQTLFAHFGGDAGVAQSWRAGVSWFSTKPEKRQYEDANATTGDLVTNQFSGTSDTAVLDAVWKWAENGNANLRTLVLQAEFFWRRESGTLTCCGATDSSLTSQQSGWYLQAVHQFVRYWRAGIRHDELARASLAMSALKYEDVPLLKPYGARRDTLMLDWSPSEFSRLRLQIAADQTRPGITDTQWGVQYIMSLGAHGAHKF